VYEPSIIPKNFKFKSILFFPSRYQDEVSSSYYKSPSPIDVSLDKFTIDTCGLANINVLDVCKGVTSFRRFIKYGGPIMWIIKSFLMWFVLILKLCGFNMQCNCFFITSNIVFMCHVQV
jgi:hypothetical protein